MEIKGHVSLEIIDKNGNIKQKVEKDNVATNTFVKYMLYQTILQTGQTGLFSTGTGAAQTNAFAVAAHTPAFSSQLGIYMMNKTLDASADTTVRPYLKLPIGGIPTIAELDPSVEFYYDTSIAVAASETNTTLVPQPNRGGFSSGKTHKITFEFLKSSYVGKIKSVSIGISHLANTNFVVYIIDKKIHTDFFGGFGQHWGLVYNQNIKQNGFDIFKFKADSSNSKTSNAKSINLNKYNVKDYTNTTGATTTLKTNFDAIMAPIIIGNDMWGCLQAVVKSAGTSTALKIGRIKNYLTATTLETFEIVITPPSGSSFTLQSTMHPIMVPREDDQNKLWLDVFITHSFGTKSAEAGAFTTKITFDPSLVTTLAISHTSTDLGARPYAISSGYSTTYYNLNTAQLGAYHDGKYYLPINSTYDSLTGARIDSTNTIYASTATRKYGVVLDSNLNFVRYYNASTGTATYGYYAMPVVVNDEVKFIVPNLANYFHYIESGEVMSLLNFDEEIEKEADDILRFSYSYQIL